MNRRNFSALGLSALALASAGLAQAQGGPIEGKHFKRLASPLPTTPGKIEVTEFFWYGCPHCYALEPMLQEWVKQLPPDVVFRRVHVGFRPNIKPHQKLFYALDGLGKAEEYHQRVFAAFHQQRLELDDDKAIIALATKMGLDTAKFTAMYNSFGIESKLLQANKLFEAYNMDGVPAIAIGGRFWTSPSMVGERGMTEQEQGMRALQVANSLIQRARSSKP